MNRPSFYLQLFATITVLFSLLSCNFWLRNGFVHVPPTFHDVTSYCSFGSTQRQLKKYDDRSNSSMLRRRGTGIIWTRVYQQTGSGNEDDNSLSKNLSSSQMRRAFLASTLLAGVQLTVSNAYAPPGFIRIPTQFIAAIGDPDANAGIGAENWGLWEKDPGPRGVWLDDYSSLKKNDGKAPAGWQFDENDWWLEEHGLIMESPQFPLSPGKYLVTGGRLVTTVLNISEVGGKPESLKWSLEDKSAKLYDVTHLPCRSARYTPNSGGGGPETAIKRNFPVSPGAVMPEVSGCDKVDYAVLFVIGKEK